MCGIAGLYAFNPSAPPADRAQLRTVRDHLTARGPDGFGEWFSDNGRVAFGHRRLAIIDLTEGGAQPMHSADGQLVITFNGEIYNYRELRQDLESQGHVFRSDSDTEVLLHLYQAKGTAMLQDLRGMYAFALWDARKQALLLARDPFGIKPLYYTPTSTTNSTSNGTLRFASQVKALLAGGQIDTAPEPAGHNGFFLWGSVPAPYTLYRGIRALPAGHYLWVGAQGAAEPQPFCQITDILAHAAANPACGTQGDALDAIGAAVRSSIAAHHVADVPVADKGCMFLSPDQVVSGNVCRLGAKVAGLPDTFLWGDSHAEALAPGVAEQAERAGKAVLFAGQHGCGIGQHFWDTSWAERECAAFDKAMLDYLLAQPSIKQVLVQHLFCNFKQCNL